MTDPIHRVNLIVLDSVGCGDAPDAAAYDDAGSNTLQLGPCRRRAEPAAPGALGRQSDQY